MNVPVLLLSAVLAFAAAKLVCGKRPGQRIERSLRFRIGDHYLHIHHWIYSSVILTALIIAGWYDAVVYGTLFGLIIHGLSYPDRFVIYYHTDDFERIYSRYQP